ncbi:MAG: adenylate kinase family protein [Halobacteriales archaeon]|nr:adenylate kinase family protein [Halobacteriales archaeon]
MRVALTGTPGTGKTTVASQLDTDLTVIHLNDVITDVDLVASVDTDRGSWVADLEAVEDWLSGREDVLVASHLAHLVPVDRVIVLRCHPHELIRRLTDRGEPPEKARENAESEALDLILAEAVDRVGEGKVYEIDTTDRTPSAVAAEVRDAIRDEREPAVGAVSFLAALEELELGEAGGTPREVTDS